MPSRRRDGPAAAPQRRAPPRDEVWDRQPRRSARRSSGPPRDDVWDLPLISPRPAGARQSSDASAEQLVADAALLATPIDPLPTTQEEAEVTHDELDFAAMMTSWRLSGSPSSLQAGSAVADAIEQQAAPEASPLAALGGTVCVVTGAQGMFGRRLCDALLAAGVSEVRGFDRVAPRPAAAAAAAAPAMHGRSPSRSRSPSVSPGVGGRRRSRRLSSRSVAAQPDLQQGSAVDFCGDITSSPELAKACRGADCVFHAASYGMSGREMLDRAQTRAVNIGGTQHVIQCCETEGVAALVYTSSYNVVFGGQAVDLGDESLAYFPPEKHADEYSRTKGLAEQLVLEASSSNGLRTVAMRSAAIYGEGEQRHFPRIIETMRAGMYLFTIGDASNQCDWVHADNLVHAHLLGAAALLAPLRNAAVPAAAGRGFFISDGSPINNFAFLAPICEIVGIPRPPLRLPIGLAFCIAHCLELSYILLTWLTFGCVAVPPPMLSRAEVLKVGMHHTFSCRGAREAFGYQPVVTAEDGHRRLMADLAERFPFEPLWWQRWHVFWLLALALAFAGTWALS